jgi:hypothetical protein
MSATVAPAHEWQLWAFVWQITVLYWDRLQSGLPVSENRRTN